MTRPEPRIVTIGYELGAWVVAGLIIAVVLVFLVNMVSIVAPIMWAAVR